MRIREWQAFAHAGRTDGLVLHHWKTKAEGRSSTQGGTTTPGDAASENQIDGGAPQPQVRQNDWFQKYNIKVPVPEYTVEQYQTHLKSDEWAKEETDYLMSLARDFDLRWIVIADRYEYLSGISSGGSDMMAITLAPKPRPMEDLKARYYEVATKMMALSTPLPNMSASEFSLHEKMSKFNAERETARKRFAENLLRRDPAEIKEEEILLGELKRIQLNEEKLHQERKELFSRLESPPSKGSIAMYETSQGLYHLMQNLINNDKNKKRKSIAAGDAVSSPATGTAGQAGPGQTPREQRGSIANGSHSKKGSVSLGPVTRQLTPREEARFGILHNEKVEKTSSAVILRHRKIEALVQAKSASQSAKLQDALIVLGVPVRAVMPTARVTEAYEKLVSKIQTLLEARRHSERIENEVRIVTHQKEMRERKERGEEEEEGEGGKEEEQAAEEDEEQTINKRDGDEDDNAAENEDGDEEDGDGDGDEDADGDEEAEDDEEEEEDAGPALDNDEQEEEQEEGDEDDEENNESEQEDEDEQEDEEDDDDNPDEDAPEPDAADDEPEPQAADGDDDDDDNEEAADSDNDNPDDLAGSAPSVRSRKRSVSASATSGGSRNSKRQRK